MWLGVLVSFLFAYLALRGVDFGALRVALAQSDYWMLVPAGLVLAVAVVLRAIRWRILFSPERRPPTGAVINAVLIGYFFNTTLPARAGEAARVLALNQRAGTPRFEALGTVAAERALDVLTLLVLFFVTVPVLPRAEWLPEALVLAALLFAILALVVVAFALYGRRPARLILRPLAALPGMSSERTDTAASNLVHGFRVFRRLGIALPASALTAASWLLIAFSFWLVLLGFNPDLGFEAGLLVVVATNLAMIIPSGPAAVGVFEAATVAALLPFGADRATALSYAIVLHALNALPFIVVGYGAVHYHAIEVRRAGMRRRAKQLVGGQATPSAD
jgi:glycosyltransferase 2 family protein